MSKKEDFHNILQDVLRVRAELGRYPTQREYFQQYGKFHIRAVIQEYGSWGNLRSAAILEEPDEPEREPKILIFDIETSPMLAYVWGLFDQNVGLNQIKEDWHVLAWAAKWLGKKEVMYMDQRDAKDMADDRKILKKIWELLDECDVVITQNGKRFDSKKLNARFLIHGMDPPNVYRHIDTRQLAQKHFAMTSNKLEYLAGTLNKDNKKSQHKEFSGFELWRECLKGNIRAWKEMEKYNKQDVLATEELYKKLAPWGGTGVDLNTIRGGSEFACQCGSKDFQKNGFAYTNSGKFQRYRCSACGSRITDSGGARNMFMKKKKESLRGP